MSKNSKTDRQLDQYDHNMLAILSQYGRISVTDLADKVGLSKSPCQVRLKRLQQDGYIKGFRAELNAELLGLEHVAFAEVKLKNTSESSLEAFNEAARKITEIEQCHMIAGAFDYLLKVRTRDIQAYRRVLGEKISTLPNVQSTSTYVCMQAVKENGVLEV
ncbi:Lrp/AsnC family transcriptional regulator [Leucothrix pacifica]|uniref:Leucine-responsive regulatory protein n=1 Tax=Leucothrix pacifica TaxID=1247513 RepID=A0A317CGX2_9GAMM|nr:Lrp/AsnC ligand binding domain-containing protein [Leucothrix pacifica]PWQ95492.1 ArsR family transcriptional regulator [Leucothrix pacifica]